MTSAGHNFDSDESPVGDNPTPEESHSAARITTPDSATSTPTVPSAPSVASTSSRDSYQPSSRVRYARRKADEGQELTDDDRGISGGSHRSTRSRFSHSSSTDNSVTPAVDVVSSRGKSPEITRVLAPELEEILQEVGKVIVGQTRLIERILVGLLAKGHILLEGVPGVAKTLTVETFAKVISGTFSRIQFTPDLVPNDLIGNRIYRASKETFDIELGPVVANLVLADEINRAPAKVQSALLEVMAESKVTIGGKTFPMPDPYLVLATQNPIENEGVYPLPEAQRDRFLFKLIVNYPSIEEERAIIYRMGVKPPHAHEVVTLEKLRELQVRASEVFVHHSLVDYVVRFIEATRNPLAIGLGDVAAWLAYGASPRASLGIISAARALAFIRQRDFVVPQDIVDVIPDVLRHRLILTYEATADGIPVDFVIERILQAVPLPTVSRVV